MSARELQPLVGRTVSVFWHGQREGVVKSVSKAGLLVKMHEPYGRRRVTLDRVAYVYWYRRRLSVAEFLEAKGKA